MIKMDFKHSEMFPYAIALAKNRGAKFIHVGEPRIRGSKRTKWLEPDVLGIKDSIFIIVECEKSHGKIFDKGGKLDTWSCDEEIVNSSEFHFILRGVSHHRKWAKAQGVTLETCATQRKPRRLLVSVGPRW